MLHFIIGFAILVAVFGIWPHVATALLKLGALAGLAGGVVIGIIYLISQVH
jgi:hypothetical protein